MIHFSVTFFIICHCWHHMSPELSLKQQYEWRCFLVTWFAGDLQGDHLGACGGGGWVLLVCFPAGEGVPLSRPSVTRAPCLLHHHPGHPGICPLLRRAGEKRNRFSISCKSNKEMGTLLKRAWIEVIWSRGDKPAPAALGRPGSPGLYLGQPL